VQVLSFDDQPLGRDGAGLPVPATIHLDAERIARRLQRAHVRVGLQQVGLGGHQIGLGDPHAGFRAALGFRVEGHTGRDLDPVMPPGGHDFGVAHRDAGDVLHGHGFLVVGQRIRWCPAQPAQRGVHTRQQRGQGAVPGRDHHPEPGPSQPQTEQQRRPGRTARPRHPRALPPIELAPHARLGDPGPVGAPVPGPPTGLGLRDRAAGGPLIPLKPHRDQPLVHHIRPHMPPGTIHPLLNLLRERIDQPLPPTRARDRQPPIPPLHMPAHRLRVTPHQLRGRVRAPGQVIRLKNLHDLPVILLHGPPSSPRVQRQPGVHRWGDHPERTDTPPARTTPTGRSAVRGTGDAMSAYKENGVSAVSVQTGR
jgi:hypothetical protein